MTIAGGNFEPSRALPAWYYLDRDQYHKELDRVFYRTWQYACHASQVDQAGAYVTFQVAGQSLLVIRGADMRLRAFYNVCQHRAHELLEGAGTVRTVTCPYHAWTYQLDGRLRHAPNTDNVPGFDRRSICLSEVKLEDFCGFIFVNLDPDAEPMSSWFPGAAEELREYVPQIDRLVPLLSVPVEEECNWKVSVENYSECYHCRIAHPTFTSGVIDPEKYRIAAQGYCLRHTTTGVSQDQMRYAVGGDDTSHAFDYSSWFLWPSFSFQVYPGNILNTYHWFPGQVDQVTVTRGWYSVDGHANPQIEELAELDRTTTVAEDIRLVNSVQRGLASLGYRSGPLVLDPSEGVESEHTIRSLNQWLHQSLSGVRRAAAASDQWRDLEVTSVQAEGDDIKRFELVDPTGEPLEPFEPGAHVMVDLPGIGRRHYSLCNDWRERGRYEIAVTRVPRGNGGSSHLLQHVERGQTLRVSTPRNHFPLASGSGFACLIAGGIGITPLLAMIRKLEATGRPYHLHYCTRDPNRTAFRSMLESAPYRDHVTFYFDGGNPALGLDCESLLSQQTHGTEIYCCGPLGLMQAVKKAARDWSPERLHFEFFSGEPNAETTQEDNRPFEAIIGSTGHTIAVAANESLLDALERHGIRVDRLCEHGICGTCITGVKDGEPEHRDSVLTPKERSEGKLIAVCCSRAKSPRLVLDL